jgi:hypothetical protein
MKFSVIILPILLFFQTLVGEEVKKDLVNRALEISPYNATAYGFIVVLLILVSILLYRNWMKADKALDKKDDYIAEVIREYNQETLRTLNMLEIRLSDQKMFGDTMVSIKADIATMKTIIETRIDRINDKIDSLHKNK